MAAAAEDATTAVSNLADKVKGNASEAADEAGKAADKAAETDDDATTAATDLADEVKGRNPDPSPMGRHLKRRLGAPTRR